MGVQPLYVDNPTPSPAFVLDANRLRDEVNDPYEPYTLISVALAAGGTADLPGPASGYVRLYDHVLICANAIGSATTGITVVLIDASAVSWSMTSAGITGTDSRQAVVLTPIGYGETVRVSNAGVNAARVFSTYKDVPATNMTLIRQAITAAAAQTVIPAPATGYFSRWMQAMTRVGGQQTINARVQWNNPDAVTHSLQHHFGGTLVARSATLAAAGGVALGTPSGAAVVGASAPWACNLSEAVNTTAPHILGAYETLPIPTTR